MAGRWRGYLHSLLIDHFFGLPVVPRAAQGFYSFLNTANEEERYG
jgi:hypothetical protein